MPNLSKATALHIITEMFRKNLISPEKAKNQRKEIPHGLSYTFGSPRLLYGESASTFFAFDNFCYLVHFDTMRLF